MTKKTFFILFTVLFLAGILTSNANANHSWNGYHWARTGNPFTLKLGDNISSLWDNYLGIASTDWTLSSVLNTTIVSGLGGKNCKPSAGRVEVCNKKYGNNGWLGIAQIWVNGSHITQAVTKMNDTYFNLKTYNTPAWKQFVVCQEIGHTFGLDHQDENFSNANLGTCMNYTNDPDGTIRGQMDNKHPNQHDYDMLETIYAHLDSFSTLLGKIGKTASASILVEKVDDNIDISNSSEWGKVIRKGSNGRSSLHERDLGKGNKVFTFVIWAE